MPFLTAVFSSLFPPPPLSPSCMDGYSRCCRCDKGGRTPLWAALHPGGSAKAEACPERRSAVVRALLAAGADVHLLPDVRDRDYCWQVLAQSIAAGE